MDGTLILYPGPLSTDGHPPKEHYNIKRILYHPLENNVRTRMYRDIKARCIRFAKLLHNDRPLMALRGMPLCTMGRNRQVVHIDRPPTALQGV